MTTPSQYSNILVATDFLPSSESALNQAIWLARQSRARITLAHILPDLRKALLAASPSAQLDAVLGQGDKFQDEIREESFARMHHLIGKLNANDLDIHCQVLLGDPSISLIHAVQKAHHDLVLVGTRGDAAWEHFVMGSTAKRLIRKCPAVVWTAKAGAMVPPKTILVATDFSDVSKRALAEGLRLATQTGAELHVVHVMDLDNMPEGAIERLPSGWQLREQYQAAARTLLETTVNGLGFDAKQVVPHITWGVPPREIAKLSVELRVDLLVLGSVGRSGIKGVLLGNTAERLLDLCDCSILTVKPADYVSPIEPAFWPLDTEQK